MKSAPVAMAAALLLQACGEAPTTPPDPVYSIEVTPAADTLTSAGRTVRFSALARDVDYETIPSVKFTWTSGDTAVAMVDSTGLATARRSGIATITAAAAGKTGTAVLTVAQVIAALAFITPPGTAEGQVAIAPAIRVALQDSSGQTVAGASGPIALRLAVNPSGATLSGTTTVTAVDGIATFTDLSLELPGDGFVLEAQRAGLSSVVSPAFSVRLTFVQSSVGNFHSCGVTVAAFAYCWGSNNGGQYGDSTLPRRERPGPVAGNLRFAQVSVGAVHTCGVTTGNVAYCWGVNELYRLGDGTTQNHELPTLVAGAFPFVQISAGEVHTCAVTTAGNAYCWGFNAAGQTGDSTVGQTQTPALVAGGLTFAQVSAGGQHSCGITTAHIAYCWGDNGAGQSGDSTTTTPRLTPTPVAGNLRLAQVSAGGIHTCGVTTDSVAYCWGFNNHGQVGDSTMSQRNAPTLVMPGLRVVQVSAGYVYTCAVTASRAAYCWGRNDSGQAGDGTSTSPRLTPTPVLGALVFTRVSARSSHTCGVTTGNVAYCWGFNSQGELGNGSTNSSFTPARVVQ